MDPANFFFIMNREYGQADSEVITRWVTQLQSPIPPNSTVRDLVSSHRDLHAKLNLARGYAIHADEAVRALVEATKYSSLRPAIVTWLTEHRLAANQDFDALAQHLCQVELVTESLAAPSAGTLYSGLQANAMLDTVIQANAATTAPPVTNADLLQAIHGLVLSVRGAPNHTKSGPKPVAKTPQFYCWTHGYCGHSGSSCQRPATGHIAAASDGNIQGGNSKTWSRPNK
jgi:hypothetical protein